MARAEVAPATGRHADYLADRLRPEHVREIGELGAMSPAAALEFSFASSVAAVAVLIDGKPLCMAGASRPDLLSGASDAWMLGSAEMDRHPRALRRAFAGVMRLARETTGAASLEQWVPDWYGAGRRWAERLGFRRVEEAARGREGIPCGRYMLKLSSLSATGEKPWAS